MFFPLIIHFWNVLYMVHIMWLMVQKEIFYNVLDLMEKSSIPQLFPIPPTFWSQKSQKNFPLPPPYFLREVHPPDSPREKAFQTCKKSIIQVWSKKNIPYLPPSPFHALSFVIYALTTFTMHACGKKAKDLNLLSSIPEELSKKTLKKLETS